MTNDKTEVQPSSFLNKNLLMVYGGTFLSVVSAHMLYPLLPLYAERMGAAKWEIGFLTGAFATGALILRIAAGYHVDRHGRKTTLVLGAILYVAACLLYPFMPTPFYLLLARVVHGAGLGAYAVASMALVVDIAPAGRVGEAMSHYGVAILAGSLLGTGSSGFVKEGIGYNGAFYLAAVLNLLCFFCVIGLREKFQKKSSAQLSYRQVLKDINVIGASDGLLFIMLAYGTAITFLPIYLNQKGFSSRAIGIFFATSAVANLIFRPVIGRMSDRYDKRILAVPSMLGLAAVFVALAFCSAYYELLLLSFLYGTMLSAATLVFFAMSVDSIPAENRGGAVAVAGAMTEVGIGLGSAGMGLVATVTSVRSLFPLAGALVFLGMVLLLLLQAKASR